MQTGAEHRVVGFGEAPGLFFQNFANFSGRSSRGAYWWWFLISFLIGIGLGIVDGIVFGSTGAPIGIFGLVFALATLIPSLAVGIRRLHDTDKSGWWVLIAFIPIVGALVLIYFMAQPGQRSDNKYGPDVEAGRG